MSFSTQNCCDEQVYWKQNVLCLVINAEGSFTNWVLNTKCIKCCIHNGVATFLLIECYVDRLGSVAPVGRLLAYICIDCTLILFIAIGSLQIDRK